MEKRNITLLTIACKSDGSAQSVQKAEGHGQFVFGLYDFTIMSANINLPLPDSL